MVLTPTHAHTHSHPHPQLQVQDKVGRAQDILPGWDIRKELTDRIWHNFWDSVMFNKCSQEVRDRFQELLAVTADVGLKHIEDHFRVLESDPERAAARRWCQENLEGVDVYFKGESHDGHLDSATCFGKVGCGGWLGGGSCLCSHENVCVYVTDVH